MAGDPGRRRAAVRTIGAGYAAVMLYVLFFRGRFDIGGSYWARLAMNVNLVPLRTIRQMAYLLVYGSNPRLIPYAAVNLLGNIAGFIPLGILLPAMWSGLRSFRRTVLCAGGIILLSEGIQLFTLRGSFDVDDVILDLTGVSAGFLLRRLTVRQRGGSGLPGREDKP